jgi:PAS domain S-box-containing protein
MRNAQGNWRIGSKLPLFGGIAAVIFAACGALLYFQYADALTLAQDTAGRIFAAGAARAEEQIDGILDRAIALSRIGPTLKKSSAEPVRGDGVGHPVLDFLITAVNSGPSIYAAYYGFADGSFIQAVATHGDPTILGALGAPAGTAIVVRTIIPVNAHAATEYKTFLDSASTILSRQVDADITFDPRERDWYRRASAVDEPVLSQPYTFSSAPVTGVTVATTLPAKRGVFAVDIALSELSRFIAGHPISPNGALYIFDNSLNVIAAPPTGPNGVPTKKLMSDMRSLGSPLLQALADFARSGAFDHTTLVRIKSDRYVALVSLWHGRATSPIDVGIVAPLDDFTDRMALILLRTLFATTAILLSAIVLVSWFSRQSSLLRRSERQLIARGEELEAANALMAEQRRVVEEQANALRREHEHVVAILDSAPVAVVMTSDNVVRYVNRRATMLLDVTAGDEAPDSYVDAGDRERLMTKLARDGIAADAEIKMRGPDGAIRDVLMTLTTIDYENRKGILAWIVDISRIKEFEERLQDSEAYAQALFMQSHIPIAVMDPQTARFVDCNLAAVTTLGFASREEIHGKTALDFSATTQYDGSASATAYEVPARRSDGITVFDWRMRRSDGSIWDAVVHQAQISHRGKTLVRYTMEDVTERKRAREALRESEAYNKLLFQESRLPIVVADPDTGKFIDCNQAAIDIYRFTSREEVLGKTPLDVSAPTQYDGTDSRTASMRRDNAALKEGIEVFDWRHQRPDGTIWDAEVHLMSFTYHGKTLLQFTLDDVTERRGGGRASRSERCGGRSYEDEIRLPCQHEPRNSHADERNHRSLAPCHKNAAQSTAKGLPGEDPAIRPAPPRHHQRHSGFLQDRSRQAQRREHRLRSRQGAGECQQSHLREGFREGP